MHLKNVPDTAQIDNDSQQSGTNEIMPQDNSLDAIPDKHLEAQIINSLEDHDLQEKIKVLLQEVMRDELSKMSVVLREAVRNWVFREKQKYHLTQDTSQEDAEKELKRIEADRKQLEKENQKLKRDLELKDHENKIMLSAIKKMTPSTK